jgi:hypothetical protein
MYWIANWLLLNNIKVDMSITNLILLVGTALLLLVCYIIARVKSKRGSMVLTVNRWDMTLLLAGPVIFVLGWCLGSIQILNTIRIILFSLAGLCLLGSIVFSIVANKESVWKVLCSVLAKLFIAILTVVGVVVLLCVLVFILIKRFMGRIEQEGVGFVKYDAVLREYVCYWI